MTRWRRLESGEAEYWPFASEPATTAVDQDHKQEGSMEWSRSVASTGLSEVPLQLFDQYVSPEEFQPRLRSGVPANQLTYAIVEAELELNAFVVHGTVLNDSIGAA